LHAVLGVSGYSPVMTQKQAASQIFIGQTATKFIEESYSQSRSWWSSLSSSLF
jgi:hypothetical protein